MALAGCAAPDLPDPASSDYRQTVTAFYTAVASVQSGEDLGAEANLLRVSELAPAEPAAWYNLGLLALRQNRFEEGEVRLLKALELAAENGDVHRLLGMMELTKGNSEAGVAYLRSAIERNAGDAKALYALAQELIRSGSPAGMEEAATLFDTLADLLPENTVVLIERTRLAALRDDTTGMNRAFTALAAFSVDWPVEASEPFAALRDAVARGNTAQAQIQTGFLRNVLLSTYLFRQNLLRVQTPVEEVGELMTRFVRLPSPSPAPSPADLDVAFTDAPSPAGIENASWVAVQSLDGNPEMSVVAAGPEFLSIDGARFDRTASDADFGVALLDHNYDFLVDVALADASGLRLFEHDSSTGFSERDARVAFGDAARVPYSGVWAADIDMEGDLDLVLASPEAGASILRNNGDGSFTRMDLFRDVTHLHDFAWADFDGDGDPDPAFLDARGELFLYSNERLGRYVRRIVPPIFGNAIALAAADVDANGRMDLGVLMDNGAVYAMASDPVEGWVVGQLVQWEGLAEPLPASSVLMMGDVDNNGAIDVVVGAESASMAWVMTGPASYQAIRAPVNGFALGLADYTADGRLDLVGLDASRRVALWGNSGSKAYHWQTLRPRAGQALGDQRINSFTIGGEIEIRADLLYQKQPVASPVVHFGLGDRERTDVARIIWPNGDIQSEFELEADQSIFTPQRLKGSCPWLFTFDGEGMRFVTDFIWRSPLGLRINAQETAGVMTTEDWVKIPGDALAPRDGAYDVRITAELWETHFFDHVSLLAVDRPIGTEMFVDERFAFPPPAMKAHAFSLVQPVRRVTTDAGADVTETIALRDGRYLDFFGRGAYQGITRDHYVEIELGEEAGEDVSLVAFGWVRPTDSSINVAISQGRHAPPRGIRLEAADGRGGWRVVHENLGFPAGKTKTVLFDLDGAFEEGAPRIVRLYTNLEIYWDHIGWAEAADDALLRIQSVPLRSAELRYRGFSEVSAADRSSPELPVYDRLLGTSPRWQDLEGYYTRFGDVDELLAQVDDRYVIMNAGDEMRFRFEAVPPPQEGWTRDFILVGDGWVKDGDYNTAFSKTVLPLPSHASAEYDTPPTTLWEDPVYKKHAADWQTYHTRYVAGDRVGRSLRSL